MYRYVKARESLVWARDYSSPKHAHCDCEILERTLGKMPGMRRVVVGHTIQQPGGVNGKGFITCLQSSTFFKPHLSC